MQLRILQPLRHRDFRLLWIGQSVSQIAAAIFVIAGAVSVVYSVVAPVLSRSIRELE